MDPAQRVGKVNLPCSVTQVKKDITVKEEVMYGGENNDFDC